VALKVKLGLVENLVERDIGRACDSLQQLQVDATEALETLRDLARGIYPPILADRGLLAALESQARKATIPVTVEATALRRYPQELEATMYFCVLEALQNVQKYADAGHATVRLHESNSTLGFSVIDDGRGFDSDRMVRGSGLTNMRDRLDALGGTLAVVSHPGHGCRVEGIVPVTASPIASSAVSAGPAAVLA